MITLHCRRVTPLLASAFVFDPETIQPEGLPKQNGCPAAPGCCHWRWWATDSAWPVTTSVLCWLPSPSQEHWRSATSPPFNCDGLVASIPCGPFCSFIPSRTVPYSPPLASHWSGHLSHPTSISRLQRKSCFKDGAEMKGMPVSLYPTKVQGRPPPRIKENQRAASTVLPFPSLAISA